MAHAPLSIVCALRWGWPEATHGCRRTCRLCLRAAQTWRRSCCGRALATGLSKMQVGVLKPLSACHRLLTNSYPCPTPTPLAPVHHACVCAAALSPTEAQSPVRTAGSLMLSPGGETVLNEVGHPTHPLTCSLQLHSYAHTRTHTLAALPASASLANHLFPIADRDDVARRTAVAARRRVRGGAVARIPE